MVFLINAYIASSEYVSPVDIIRVSSIYAVSPMSLFCTGKGHLVSFIAQEGTEEGMVSRISQGLQWNLLYLEDCVLYETTMPISAASHPKPRACPQAIHHSLPQLISPPFRSSTSSTPNHQQTTTNTTTSSSSKCAFTSETAGTARMEIRT